MLVIKTVKALQPIVARLLSPRGSVLVDERTNVLIITDVETEVETEIDRVRSQLRWEL